MTDEQLMELARGAIERCVDCCDESADTIYDECYVAAFDALHDAGHDDATCRRIASRAAQDIAQP